MKGIDTVSSSSLLRMLVIAIPGCVLALYLAAQIGNGQLKVPILFLIGVPLFVGVTALTRQIRIEAVILGFLLFGYIVGQSGFAHFSISERTNLYFGELGMMACAVAFLARVAFTREKIIPRRPLAWAIVAFIVIGLTRVSFDFGQSYQLKDVVRDFATVYYAGFFFIAYNVCRHSPSRRLIERVIIVSLITFIPVYIASIISPMMFQHLTIRGRPIIAPRSDLTGSFMSFACIYFFFLKTKGLRRVACIGISLIAFLIVLLAMSRATFAGLAVAMFLIVIARKSQILLWLGLSGIIGALTLAIVGSSGLGNETMVTRLQDKGLSLFEPFTGERYNYTGSTGDESAGNNQFRESWWKSVFDETTEKAPVTGLGFGYDLAKRFLRNYQSNLNIFEFDTRSPHSIILTVYGRMGLVGILSLMVIVYLILRSSIRCAVAVRNRKVPAIYIAPWCGAIAIFVTACFGVMLEGPMAAMVFWSLLGLAALRQSEMAQTQEAPHSTRLPQRPVLETAGRFDAERPAGRARFS
jgi:O-antigen ligase